jgi:hypothetical protein
MVSGTSASLSGGPAQNEKEVEGRMCKKTKNREKEKYKSQNEF